MGARTCASLALAICVAAMVLASVAVSGEAEGWVAPPAPPAPGFQVMGYPVFLPVVTREVASWRFR